MKNIKDFISFNESNQNKDYKLPNSTGDSYKDEDIFWFSTKNEEKSLVLDLFLERIKSSVDELKDKEINAQSFYCSYKQGDKVIRYKYYFWTPDDDVVKKSKGHYDGHEWLMLAEVPYDIIEKLNSGELTKEDATSKIKNESTWSLFDGMSYTDAMSKDKNGGWQVCYMKGDAELDSWLQDQKRKNAWKPQWLKDFSDWFTDNFV
jgi:hypothetical protein